MEHLVAALDPRPDVRPAVRKLPTPKPPVPAAGGAGEPAARQRPSVSRRGSEAECGETFLAPPATTPAIVAPLAPERYKVQFTVTRETYDKLRRAQDLLRHVVPNGDPAAVFDRALTVLVAELERAKLAATGRPHRATKPPKGHSRHIPATVKRAVWTRDAGQCTFVGAHGRCTETGFLEFHHVVPYATGGPATVANIELRCAAHNAYEAELGFGLSPPALMRESTPTYAAENWYRCCPNIQLGPGVPLVKSVSASSFRQKAAGKSLRKPATANCSS